MAVHGNTWLYMAIHGINNNNNNNNNNNGLISVHPWYGSSPDIKVK